MRAYSPGGALNALASAQVGLIPPTSSAHRLGRGLPGYLILFAPHAFVSQRQYQARDSPSPPVFFPISTDFTPTLGIPVSSPVLKKGSMEAVHRLSPWISPPSYLPAYIPFTPSNSEQRLLPTYCRGCWHVVSRSLFRQGRHRTRYWRALILPALKDFTIQRTFIVHAASLRQAFAHCGRFLAAASRRSLGRVSVPMWPVTLSGRLPIVALVGRYPTN